MAPSPITPSVRPGSSKPTNAFLPASTALSMLSASPSSRCANDAAGMMLRAARNSAATTSSLTAFAFAPGVLNTGMPRALYSGIGMLFVPAPARATASTDAGISTPCRLAERSSSASGCSTSEPTW
jgi:hypothetical protein